VAPATRLHKKPSFKSGAKYQQDYEELGISKQRYEKSVSDTTIESFQKWKEDIASLTRLTDKLTLLTQFAKIETNIEPTESLIQDAVAELDELINLQVDEMRLGLHPENSAEMR
jgi:hypothetical protein